MPLDSELTCLLARQPLSYEQAHAAMERMLAGEETPAQIAALLTALRMKGETAEELAGFAAAMRAAMVRVATPPGAVVVDTCGTGGDGTGTFNISTVVAFVVAGAGVVVAKHGNRAVTSRTGSADVLEALGIRVDLTPPQMAACLASCGIAFLFAPSLHPAMRHVGSVRKALGFRTVFNLLGPLANPASAPHQVIGVPSRDLARKMARALHRVGTVRSFVVHGLDGLDELTLSGGSAVYEVTAQGMAYRPLSPVDFGLEAAPLSALAGGDALANAEIARRILNGEERGPMRDVVMMNASAVLVACGVAADWLDGVAKAAASIDAGAAFGRMESLASASRLP
jgi:anthranilate phosphoribosyltransferase